MLLMTWRDYTSKNNKNNKSEKTILPEEINNVHVREAKINPVIITPKRKIMNYAEHKEENNFFLVLFVIF